MTGFHANTGDGNPRFVHGHAIKGNESPTYMSWIGMRKRCLQASHPSYSRYGGRGIAICERWNDFENFLADMGERPARKSLDRRDNNGNYEPDNCRWATPLEQMANTNVARMIELDGEMVCVPEAARRLNLPIATLWWRVKNKPESDWFRPVRGRK